MREWTLEGWIIVGVDGDLYELHTPIGGRPYWRKVPEGRRLARSLLFDTLENASRCLGAYRAPPAYGLVARRATLMLSVSRSEGDPR